MVKGFLSQKGVEYEEKAVDEDIDAYREFMELGFRGVPVTIIDGEPVLGFDQARIEELLDQSTE